MRFLFGRFFAPAAWLFAALSCSAALPAAAQAAQDNTAAVRGLIVRLKSAPAHEQLRAGPLADAREQALALTRAQADGERWQRVLSATGLSRGAALRPTGRDQQLIAFAQPLSPAKARALMLMLRARADVDWVEPNTRERRLQVPDDPFFVAGGQWWLRPVGGIDGNVLADRRRGVAGVQSAWLQPGGTGAPAAVVAVLDTGITSHPDIAGHVLPGYDFVSPDAVAGLEFAADGDGRDADPSDPGDGVSSVDKQRNPAAFEGCDETPSSWHGTVISGIVGASTNNTLGVAGIHWDARVLPVRVAGKCGATVADIVDGMRWAAGLAVTGVPTVNPNPARILNISFGGSNACGAAYQTAIDELKTLGVVVIAAAGNEHVTPTRPANCTGVVGVVGLNRDGFKSHYSNFGRALTATGLAVASGDDTGGPSPLWNRLADDGILTLGNSGTFVPADHIYANLSGTSFAAPQVAGVASLMLSVNPQLGADQLIDGLRKSARPHVTSPWIGACSWANPGRCACTTGTCGAGILDAARALMYAASPATPLPVLSPDVLNDVADLQAAAAQGPDRPANPLPDPNDTPPPSGGNGGGGGGGGGGSMSGAWMLALALAALLLSACGRSSRGSRVGTRRG